MRRQSIVRDGWGRAGKGNLRERKKKKKKRMQFIALKGAHV